MRAAVIGRGLAGLSSAFFLSQKGYKVTLFDKDALPKSASSVASGLCHPYPGRDGKPSKFAKEALAETTALLEHVEKVSGTSHAKRIAFLRKNKEIPLSYPDLEQVEDGTLIHSGLLFDMESYLKALFLAIPDLTFTQKEVSLSDPLPEFSSVVFALGGGFQKERIDLPLQYIKGQVLIASTAEKFERPILGNGHLIPLGEGKVLLGSTYEHHFTDDLPDLESAQNLLRKRLSTFLPSFDSFVPLSAKSGIRVAQKGSYLPYLTKLDEKRFIYTGLGSRGLLYHALYGRLLAEMVG
ncbi:MAG: FAD-binding oxidoreductase [Verrucomicrobia bacterium]|nr:FAD-binding oxidoreductase [Verrucomicrobiota bacterium]